MTHDFGPFLLLSEKDNVLVARANAAEGDRVTLETGPVQLTRAIPMAHKIARHDIACGAPILKSTIRVTFWGALAMLAIAVVGSLFGTTV